MYNEESSFEFVNSFQGHSNDITRIKQSPFNTNTNYVATCSIDNTVKIWNVYSSFNWTLIINYSQHLLPVYAMEWLDKETLASSGFTDGIIRVWSLVTGQTKQTINTNGYVRSLKLLKNKINIAAGTNGDINIYNINDGNLVSSLKGHTTYVYDLVQISGDLLASSSYDKTVRIWSLISAQLLSSNNLNEGEFKIKFLWIFLV